MEEEAACKRMWGKHQILYMRRETNVFNPVASPTTEGDQIHLNQMAV